MRCVERRQYAMLPLFVLVGSVRMTWERQLTLPSIIHLRLWNQLDGTATAVVERLGQVVWQWAWLLVAETTTSVLEVHGGRRGNQEAR